MTMMDTWQVFCYVILFLCFVEFTLEGILKGKKSKLALKCAKVMTAFSVLIMFLIYIILTVHSFDL